MKRKMTAGVLPGPEELRHGKIFVDAKISGATAAKVMSAISAENMTKTASRKDAQWFLALDPASPGSRTEWASVLGGYTILSIEALCERTGACIRYRSALKVKRQIYFTEEWKTHFVQLWDLLQSLNREFGEAWTFIHNLEAYVEQKRTCVVRN